MAVSPGSALVLIDLIFRFFVELDDKPLNTRLLAIILQYNPIKQRNLILIKKLMVPPLLAGETGVERLANHVLHTDRLVLV